MLSLAALMPTFFNQRVSTSSRRVPFSRILLYHSWPSLLKNQLTKTFVELGCGGFLITPRTPKPLLAGNPSFGGGTGFNGKPASTNGSTGLRPKPNATASLPLATASA